MTRIALGTVQLGMPYGALARAPLIAQSAAETILDCAWDLGIRVFDTAEAYGCAAERLSTWLRRRGRLAAATIVTKVVPGNRAPSHAVDALARFDGAEHRTVLTHGFASPVVWEPFADAVRRETALPGQSVYEASEVRAAIDYPGVARVQAPGNLFDDRARQTRDESPVPLDLRSVFLQGVLLLDADDAQRRIVGANQLVTAVRAGASRVGAPLPELLIAAVMRRLRRGDRVVLGADSADQLHVIPGAIALCEQAPTMVDEFTEHALAGLSRPIRSEVLDPRRWTA